jgi:hypothetical protein
MCVSVPTCESVETVMLRVAAEIGVAARDLAAVESQVVDALAKRSASANLDQLQSIDRIGQQLRTLEAFLEGAGMCRCGRVDVERGLDEVWLESVRARLGGVPVSVAPAGEVEVW